ncbi:MAG TPA: hypothetical protein DIU37_01405 [Opitutae bacterium]|nr:hypothetical protein [Opitutae bacterium]|tara:strand:+ start:689 stop:1171 length:483 start_codon:yes stop_codon:yes gene_type:complete
MSNAETVLINILETAHHLAIATVDDLGNPHASYTPFVVDKHKHFYIFISEVSASTANLLNNKEASIMVLNPQSAHGDPFAPERLRLQCNVVPVLKGSEIWHSTVDLFKARFKDKVSTITQDEENFLLIQLKPFRGRLVLNKSDIFDISGNNLEEIKPFKP